MPTQLAFTCMLIAIIIANQLGSYIRNNSVPFGLWFILKVRYWSNHAIISYSFISKQLVLGSVARLVVQCQ